MELLPYENTNDRDKFSQEISNNFLQQMILRHIKVIEKSRESGNTEDIKLSINILIHLLPQNVTSLSIPISDGNETKYITTERGINIPKEEQTDWKLGDLIEYAINIKDEGILLED